MSVPKIPGGLSGSAAAGAAGGAAARAIQGTLADAIGRAVTGPVPAKPVPAKPVPVEPAPFPPDAVRDVCERTVARYPTRMSALLPILHIAQRHFGGWVSPEVEAGIAAYLDLSPAHVRGVLTFYAMYHTEPRGRHEVWVCRTLTCWLRGAQKLSELAHEKAGLVRKGNNHPQTSEDGKFTLMEMECLGLCEVAPAVFVDGEPHTGVTPDELSKLMDACD